MTESRVVLAVDAEGNIVKRYASPTEAAEDYHITTGAAYYRIKSHTCKNGVRLVYQDTWDGQPLSTVKMKRSLSKHSDEIFERKDDVLDESRYELRSYECRQKFINVTPCGRKFKPDGSPIFIGSVACQSCVSFHGIDRSRKMIACGFNFNYIKGKK